VASSLLDDLASDGVVSRSEDEVARLIEQFQAGCDDNDDQVSCLFVDVLKRLESWRARHEPSGGVPRQALDEIDDALRSAAATAIIGNSLESTTETLARIDLLMTGPEMWQKRGQAKPRYLDE
jgi:hypothetical protein